ncbi:hypothetical protein DYB32_006815 [Aphanomyces invadans]|uniref:RRM domain-containing protein n=1 Tax=Aphanomyces invadans TaxID=157072 RepID=A0A418AQH5_9STRA|nr:hypothetical protein DYB32_006815 [Aphanomyces invadans]
MFANNKITDMLSIPKPSNKGFQLLWVPLKVESRRVNNLNCTLTAKHHNHTFKAVPRPPGCNLFVFHIPNDMTNQDLFNYFQSFGNVISARIMVEKETGRFVSYDNAPSADAAIKGMNGYQVGRKRLKVQHKKEKGSGGGLYDEDAEEAASPAPQ